MTDSDTPPRADAGPRAATPPGLRTVGIEEELLLVDAETLQLVPVAGSVLENVLSGAPATPPGTSLVFEVKQEQIEVVSPPFQTFDELARTIVDGRTAADAAARTAGARAVALATSVLPVESHLVPEPRYERMRSRFGLTLREQLTCGCHVHVAVGSADEGVAVLDRIRPWLPVLLALSANSPFWQGVATEFASFRYQAWNRWPSAGPYDLYGGVESYLEREEEELAAGIAIDEGMIYSDARLSHHAPTVEVRIADVCLRPADATALALLVRALVETAVAEWSAGVPADPVPMSFLRLASWRASKSGLNDSLVHPTSRRPVAAAGAVDALLTHVRDRFSSAEEERVVLGTVSEILRAGTGERRQRAAMGVRGERRDVIAEAVVQTTRF
jgi:carboxylate-amine ligase